MKKFLHKHASSLFLIFLSGSLFVLGFSAGTLNEKLKKSKSASGISFSPQIHAEIPLFTFEKIENGILYGKHEGQESRFIVGKDEEIFSVHDEEFSFSVVSILPNLKMIPAPQGMRFVGSSRGSKFWPLDAPEAALITPKNRIFFQSADDAVKKGYKKGKK
ncbi:hypothetical protein HZA38_03005 [Candidatus Peregrinibacteria bacterium]|nr:hypothetical protein [Candidatus Peregrinibacteria bacterium]